MEGLILGQIEYGIGLLYKLQKRYQVTKRNHDICEELIKGFNEVHEKLKELQSSKIPASIEKDWTSKLDDLKSYFDEAVTTLGSLWSKLDSKSRLDLGVLIRATRSKEKIEKLMKDFEKLDSKAWLLNIAGMIMLGMTQDVGRSTSEDSQFVPTFHVPENPCGVLVNFNDPNTIESALKRKVLDESSTVVGAVGAVGVVGAVGAKGASAVAATGMGGVGKTSALRAIGADKEVQDHYNGGVYFFTLGQNATSAEVINMVAAAVKNTRGNQKAREISNEQNVRSAIGKAGAWFADKRCLFICDDLWRTESKPSSYLYDLKALILSRSRSCILFSTRDLKIAEEIDEENRVPFSRRSDNEAAAILRNYAGFEDKETCSNESFQFVLKLCCGLPIALAVAGRSVQRIARTCRDRNLAWGVYKERLQEAGGEEMCTEAAGDHEGLFQALTASLEEANKLPEFRNIGDGKPIQVIHRAFCVLRKQTWAPSSMLACLWDVEERKVEKITEKMELLSLLSIERRELNRKLVLGVTLHDLVHDFCLTQAQENKEVAMWHAKLLDGYVCRSKLSKENCEKGFEGHNWWSRRLEDDKYVHAHLTYHLTESGRLEELESLMLDFRWTYRQLIVNRFLILKDDFELFRTCQRSKKPETASKHLQGPYQHGEESSDKRSSCKTSSENNKGDQHFVNVGDEIELIAGALRLSWPLLVSPKSEFTQRELAFQMMGRLCSLRRKPTVDKYLRSVEREAEGPWAKPTGPCLELPQGPTYGKFWMPAPVNAVSVMHGADFAVAGDLDGNLSILNMKSMETVRSWRGHENCVTSVAVSGNGRRIVSGSHDRTVRIWKMETGEAIGEPLRGHQDSVMSVAVSGDGQRIVSGSRDRTMRIWNMETGKAIGEPLRGHQFPVTSVAVSGDGRRIVSGSGDRTVRIWNMETGEAIGEPLRSHQDVVRSVAVSGDGRRIVSGSWDRTVRIWKMETGEAIGEPLRGHQFPVTSVAVSGDGQRIVSGSWDRTVRIWKMETGEAIGEPLRGHQFPVTSVAVSGDGQRIVSGSWDRTVRIWNMETGEAIGEPLRGHQFPVTSVAVGGDGQRIVSGSRDETVRIWNMETGKAIGEPLRGHQDWVTSVAVIGDGQRIVSGSRDRMVRIWNMETGEAIGEPLRGHQNSVTSVAVSGDGQRIVSGSRDRMVRIWNMETGEAIGEPLRGHQDWVTSVAVSGDGQRIVSGSRDRTVQIWNMETGEAIGEPLRGHQNWVTSVAVSGDGQRIVSGSRDRTVRIWNMETGETIGEPLRVHQHWEDEMVRIRDIEAGEAIGEPLGDRRDQVMSVAGSGLLDEFIKREPERNGVRGEMESARSPTTRIFCVTGHDGIFYGDVANGTGAMKIGSFEWKVNAWLLDTEGKLWAGLENGTVAVVRTMMK